MEPQQENVRRIRMIQADATLTKEEKAKQIQIILAGKYINNEERSPAISNLSKTCEHYEKKCYKFYFSCCDVYDPCKRCHLERKSCQQPILSSITCSECETEQDIKNTHCSNRECSIQFAPNHCDVCNLWTQKQITHCIHCGCCRIGTPETLYHCMDCGLCFYAHMKDSHECTGKSYRDETCTICQEAIFNSQSSSYKLICNHFAHDKCLKEAIKHNIYKCAKCRKTIMNMEKHWKMLRKKIQEIPIPKDMFLITINDITNSPYGRFKVIEKINMEDSKEILWKGEFIDWTLTSSMNATGILNESVLEKECMKSIYCNDCEKKSSVNFHFYGLECQHCGSFNTQE